MYNSLFSYVDEAVLYVVCIDDETYRVLDRMSPPNMYAVKAEEIEDEKLLTVRNERSLSEYCWTLKPVIIQYLYDNKTGADIIAYLDSDLYFFSNPLKLFNRSGAWNVIFSTHKVNKRANGGFVAFKAGNTAKEALSWWKESCIEWCYAMNDNGKFGDQGYLDIMAQKFKGVKKIDLPGVNAAPWNSYRYDLSLKDGKVYIGRSPLIFYHFSGLRLKKLGSIVAITGTDIPCILCQTYFKELQKSIAEIGKIDNSICENFYTGI
ncbi:MAG: putative nucleotide-diphospho-sugar transferase [Caulobacteraceae bacterium]